MSDKTHRSSEGGDPDETTISFKGNNWGFQLGQNVGTLRDFSFGSKAPERPKRPNNPASVLPFERDLGFMVDNTILSDIHDKLSIPGARVALCGMSGIGKTSLVNESMHQILEEEPESLIVWINGSNATHARESYNAFAERANINGTNAGDMNVVRHVHNWLATYPKKWILVFDNADYDLKLYDYLGNQDGTPSAKLINITTTFLMCIPETGHLGSIVITTQNANLAAKFAFPNNVFTVLPMSVTTSVALLRRELGIENIGLDEETLEQLARGFAYHPLAMRAAASFPNKRRLVSEFVQKHGRLEFAKIQPSYWTVSDALSIIIGRLPPWLMELLSLMSFFDTGDIPKAFLEDYYHRTRNEAGLPREMGMNIHFGISSFGVHIAEAMRCSLVTRRADSEVFTMHELCRDAVKKRLKSDGCMDLWNARFIEILHREVLNSTAQDKSHTKSIFPHLVQATLIKPPISDQKSLLGWATLLQEGASQAEALDEIVTMKKMSMSAMEVRKSLLGPEDTATRESSKTLILAYILDGKWKNAEILAKEQLAILNYGSDKKYAADQIKIMDYLSLAIQSQGRWHEAELVLENLLELSKEVLGSHHPETLNRMHNLATNCENQGRWDDAKEIYLRVLEARKLRLGLRHRDTSTSMNSLARVYQHQGQLQEAENIYVQVYEMRKEVLGLNHPETIASLSNIASIYQDQGHLRKAEDEYLKVVEHWRTIRGPIHHDTIRAIEDLASLYQVQHFWAKAKDLELQVLSVRRDILGKQHPDTIKSLIHLATITRFEGHLTQAEELYMEVLERQKSIFGPSYPEVLSSMSSLAMVYRDLGKRESASDLQKRAIRECNDLLRPDHPIKLKNMENTALLQFDDKEFQEAENSLETVLAKRQHLMGFKHPATFSTMDALVSIYEAQGREEKSLDMQSQVVARRESFFGPEHPETIVSLEKLAHLQFNRKEWKQAELLMKKVLNGRRRRLNNDDDGKLRAQQFLNQISEVILAEGLGKPEEDDTDSDTLDYTSSSGSILSVNSGKSSSVTSVGKLGVQSAAASYFTEFLMSNSNLHDICRSAIDERNISKDRVQRNLNRVLRGFASRLSQEFGSKDPWNVVKFLRSASLRISNHVIQRLDLPGPKIREKHLVEQIDKVEAKEKVEKFLRSQHVEAGDSDVSEHTETEREVIHLERYHDHEDDHEHGDKDYDSDEDVDQGDEEIEDQSIVTDLEKIQQFLLQTNAFQAMQAQFYDFVFPSFRSIMMDWIAREKRSSTSAHKASLRALEIIVSELQHIAPADISFSLREDTSIMNTLKGKWETITVESWNWWPFRPYMRRILPGETRLEWKCTCGKLRWTEVPNSFASIVMSAPRKVVQTSPRNLSLASPNPGPSNASSNIPAHQGILPSQGHGNPQGLASPTPTAMLPQLRAQNQHDLHVFLVIPNSSILQSSRSLAQTSVKLMSDHDFFTWIRSMYYQHRGFFSAWFGIHGYSHCEFFKFEKFSSARFSALHPEFPSENESSYHFSPRPISPEPPVSPHEFGHWFEQQARFLIYLRKIEQLWYGKTSSNAIPFGNDVQQRLPKRDQSLQEEDSCREFFWGLYIVQQRCISMIMFYSLIFLSPTIYFFFAWLFQWKHYGDLQNASVPLTFSIALLSVFFFIITLKSPRFEGHSKLY